MLMISSPKKMCTFIATPVQIRMPVFGKITSRDNLLDVLSLEGLEAYWKILTNVVTLEQTEVKVKAAADALSLLELIFFVGIFLRVIQMIMELVRRTTVELPTLGRTKMEATLYYLYFIFREFLGVCAASTSYVLIRLLHF